MNRFICILGIICLIILIIFVIIKPNKIDKSPDTYKSSYDSLKIICDSLKEELYGWSRNCYCCV